MDAKVMCSHVIGLLGDPYVYSIQSTPLPSCIVGASCSGVIRVVSVIDGGGGGRLPTAVMKIEVVCVGIGQPHLFRTFWLEIGKKRKAPRKKSTGRALSSATPPGRVFSRCLSVFAPVWAPTYSWMFCVLRREERLCAVLSYCMSDVANLFVVIDPCAMYSLKMFPLLTVGKLLCLACLGKSYYFGSVLPRIAQWPLG